MAQQHPFVLVYNSLGDSYKAFSRMDRLLDEIHVASLNMQYEEIIALNEQLSAMTKAQILLNDKRAILLEKLKVETIPELIENLPTPKLKAQFNEKFIPLKLLSKQCQQKTERNAQILNRQHEVMSESLSNMVLKVKA